VPPESQFSDAAYIEELRSLCPNITIVYGLVDYYHISSHPLSKLIIFDDLMRDIAKNSFVTELFTRFAHHENASVIFTSQNYFGLGANGPTILANCNYRVVFADPTDRRILATISSQLM